MTFANPDDYARIEQGDSLEIFEVPTALERGLEITVKNLAQGYEFTVMAGMTERQIAIMRAEGLLNYNKENS
ncbi:MAG: hypothetical protein ACYCVD_04825 [Desulfitobacteriaceae bacterium]